MHVFWFLLVTLIAGWLAAKIMRGSGFGVLGNIVMGVLGATLGGFLFGWAGISPHRLIGRIGVATVGAIVLIYVVRLLKRA
jgi:uncharacterized membrane protein YeaQ/YmgE (transglycosylase-associated protein family)